VIVSDTSLIAHLYLKGETSPLARQIVLRDPDWATPFLWRSEFRNTLVKCIRAGILDRDKAFRVLGAAESLMAGGEYDPVSHDVLELAATTGCSAYDAEFVALARELRVPLVTRDKELLRKFPETALTPGKFLARP
jgi:predicted nucleic acid-binding protein